MLRMIAEDCNDMGIQMNYAYASMLTGVDLDNELRANAKSIDWASPTKLNHCPARLHSPAKKPPLNLPLKRRTQNEKQ